MTDLIVLVLVAAIVGGAAWYVIRKKKQGARCIGCPAGEAACRKAGCGGNCSGCGSTCQHKD